MSDITVKKGDTLSIDRTFRVDGADVDLTSATVTSEIREQIDVTSTLVATFTVATAGAVATLSLTSAETDALTPGTYYYDIKRDVGGVVAHTTAYKFTVEKKVTA